MALQLYNHNQSLSFDPLMQSNRRIQTWLKVRHLLSTQFSTQSDQLLLESKKEQLQLLLADMPISIILSCLLKKGNNHQLIRLHDCLKTIKRNKPKQTLVLQKSPIMDTHWHCIICNTENDGSDALQCTKCGIAKPQNQALFTKEEVIQKEKEWNDLDPEWKTTWPVDRLQSYATMQKWEQSYAKMYIKYYQSIHYHSELPLNHNQESNPPFAPLSSPVIRIICSFLSKTDIIQFKATNVQNAIVCLQEMSKLSVAVYDVNKLIRNHDEDENKEIIKLNEERFVSFLRYSPNTLFGDMFAAWHRLYGIPTHRQLICDYDPSNYEHTMLITKAIANKRISSAKQCEYGWDVHLSQWIKARQDATPQSVDHIRFRGPYLLFDTRNMTVVTPHKAQRMEGHNPMAMDDGMDVDYNHNTLTLPALHPRPMQISSTHDACVPNYSLLILKYHDVTTQAQTLDIVDCICISKEVTFSRLFDYIENEYQCSAFSTHVHNRWYDAFKENVRRIRNGGGSLRTRKYSVSFEPIGSTDYTQPVPGINESSPVSCVPYLSGLGDEFVKQIMVFRFSPKATSFLESSEMDLDHCTPKQPSVPSKTTETPGNTPGNHNHNQKKRVLSETNHTKAKPHHPPKTIKKADTASFVQQRVKPMNNKAMTEPHKVSTVQQTNRKIQPTKAENNTKHTNHTNHTHHSNANRLRCLQLVRRQEENPNEFDICLMLSADQATNASFVKTLFKRINGLNHDNDTVDAFMNDAFTPHTFHCGKTRNFGMLRLELGTKLRVEPKQIEIYSRDTTTNIMQVKLWKETVQPSTHYEWRLVAYDTRKWSDCDRIYRLKLYVSLRHKSHNLKEMDCPLFIKHKSQFKMQELIDLMNRDIAAYHSTPAYTPHHNCVVTALSRSYESSELFTNEASAQTVTDLNVFIQDTNNDILTNITNLCHAQNDNNNNNDNNNDPNKKKKQKVKKRYSKSYQRDDKPPLKGITVIPEGKPGCLLGMRFVISGLLPSMTREECTAQIQSYGGRLTLQVSGVTDYLIKGEEAGEKKTKTAKQKGTQIISETEFLTLLKDLPTRVPLTRSRTKRQKKNNFNNSNSDIGNVKKNDNSNNNRNFVWFRLQTPQNGSIRIKMYTEQLFKSLKVQMLGRYGTPVKSFRFKGNTIEDNDTPNAIMNTFGAKNDDTIDVQYYAM